MRDFFISCGLGFEEDLKNEIHEFWHLLLDKLGQPQLAPLPSFIKVEGGLELTCPYEIGLQINFFSKIANRVLLRLGKFKAKNNSDLEKHLLRIPWTEYFKSAHLSVDVSSHASRLYHKKRLEELTLKILKKKITVSAPSPSNSEREAISEKVVFLRIVDDECVVSLDTSGEHLHKRGFATLKGEAPLRETLASWILRKLVDGATPQLLQQVQIVDPMCGSGTFLTEALNLFTPNLRRDFAFLHFSNCPKILRTQGYVEKVLSISTYGFTHLKGFDLSSKMVGISEKNWESATQSIFKDKVLQCPLTTQDLFNLKPSTKSPATNWVVVNPPYGGRLSKSHSFNEILEQISLVFQPQKIAFLSPSFKLNPSLLKRFNFQKNYPVLHGGLRLNLLILFSN